MTKKLFVFLGIFLSFFLFINNSSALSSDEQVFYDYFIENDYYDTEDYPACVFVYRDSGARDYGFFRCISNDNILKFYYSSGMLWSKSGDLDVFYFHLERKKSDGTISVTFNSISKVSYIDWDTSNITLYSNFDFYDSSGNVVREKNITFTPLKFYLIAFDVPEGSSLVVKDSSNSVIAPINDTTYSLKSGIYTYSVSKELFYSKENITFSVSEDTTIKVDLETKINTSSMNNIFSKYLQYFSSLIQNIFSIENTLFFFLVSIVIIVSLFILVKKLLGGSKL